MQRCSDNRFVDVVQPSWLFRVFRNKVSTHLSTQVVAWQASNLLFTSNTLKQNNPVKGTSGSLNIKHRMALAVQAEQLNFARNYPLPIATQYYPLPSHQELSNEQLHPAHSAQLSRTGSLRSRWSQQMGSGKQVRSLLKAGHHQTC